MTVPTDWSAIAQSGYERYAAIARADAMLLPVPEWEDLPPRLQEAWREAAKETCRQFMTEHDE